MIPLSELNPTKAFKSLMESKSIDTEAIYAAGEMPTSGMPSNFISLSNNGSISSLTTKGAIKQCTIACSIYAKLVNGVVNSAKNRYLLAQFEDLFESTVSHEGYDFTLDMSNLVSDSKNIMTDYSTKVLNINVKIL